MPGVHTSTSRKLIPGQLENVVAVLDRLRSAGLRLKPAKCHFAKKEVDYLGYRVSAEGMQADPKKVEAVNNFPQPQDLTIHSQLFEGCKPLFVLTRKDAPFRWEEAQQKAFVALKKLLTEAPVLSFPDFSHGYILGTDASGMGLGAVLAQRREDGAITPIAYASRTLQQHERNYGITELEALGVVWAVKHFRHYLYGSSCDVYTDHEALKALLNTPHSSGKLARWGLALQELDLPIHYRPGKRNANADALSRVPLQSNEETIPAVVVAAVLGEETTEELAAEAELDVKTRQRPDPDHLLFGVRRPSRR